MFWCDINIAQLCKFKSIRRTLQFYNNKNKLCKLKQSFWNSLYIVIFSSEWLLKGCENINVWCFCERGRNIHAVYATKYFKYWMKKYLILETSTVIIL